MKTLQKERRRWRVLYKGVLFFVNVDRLIQPNTPGLFLEIKSRTWSASDAEQKASTIHEILEIMGIPPEAIIRKEYLEM